eukprot:scaffold3811_cov53-Attheya_sp.AAC.2
MCFDNWQIWQQTCPRDIEAGVDAIARAARTTWWEWKDGSRPFHWRWPDEYIETVRDGLPVYFIRKPPKQDIKEKKIKALVLAKLKKVRDRRYIAPRQVVGLICFFEVAKCDCDIRMVYYNGSESGLNDCIWVPRFMLPTIQTHLRDPNNIFRWDSVEFNLPGSKDYDPSLPWVYKVRLSDGKIAVDVFGFVDNFRQTGNSAKEAWLAGRQFAIKSNHLGIQDAPRKRRDGSSTPGAWTGSIVHTGEDGVFLLISVDKWDKTKYLLREMQEMLATAPKRI